LCFHRGSKYRCGDNYNLQLSESLVGLVLHLREEVPLRRHESVGKERGDGGC
jgi:hypothetical protein